MKVSLILHFSFRVMELPTARVQFESVHRAERSAASSVNRERRLCARQLAAAAGGIKRLTMGALELIIYRYNRQ